MQRPKRPSAALLHRNSAMTSRAKSLVKALAVSAVVLAIVLWLADVDSIDVTRIRPLFILPTIGAYVCVLILRAVLWKQLTARDADYSFVQLLTLAGRHHIVFVTAPSGSGDLAFPVIAKRILGMPPATAIGLIAGTRVRDILTVLGLGCLGLALTGFYSVLSAAGAVICCLALYWSDFTMSVIAAALRKLRHWWRPATSPDDTARAVLATPHRAVVAALTLLLWLVASCGIYFGFAAAGHAISMFQSWIMLAGLNVAGALAVSFAGFGVAEAGATGVLVFLGMPTSVAAAVAIIARPIILLSNAASSAVVEIIIRLQRRAP